MTELGRSVQGNGLEGNGLEGNGLGARHRQRRTIEWPQRFAATHS
jgi:hypothetical protein